MKKLLVSVLAIAGLAACATDDVVRELDNRAPIAFDTFVENATRADNVSTTTGNITEFSVWAYMNEADGIVFNDELVSRSGDAWSYTNLQYWLAGNDYSFAAFAGDRDFVEGLPKGIAMDANGLGTITFTNENGTNDILYAQNYVDNAAANQQPVSFQFDHLLSKVRFTFANGFANDNNKIVVKNITMTSAEVAQLNLNTDSFAYVDDAEYVWKQHEGTKTLEFGHMAAGAKVARGENAISDEDRLVIPADATYEYTVTFDVEVYNGEQRGLEKHMEVKVSGIELVAGHSYNFVATINQENLNLNAIEFEVAVDTWEEFEYNGGAVEDEVIVLDEVVTTADEMAAALKSDANIINVKMANDIEVPISTIGTTASGDAKQMGGANTKNITIDLNGKKLNLTTTYWSVLGAKNSDAIVTIKNGTMTSSQATGTWNSYDLTFSNCNYNFEDVVFEKAIALEAANKTYNLKNVTINETHDYYAMWITAEGQNVTIDGLTVNSLGRGIKIDEQYVGAPAKVTLNIANSTFTTANKAAILVKSVAGAEINVENIDITNVAKDTEFAVWVDEDAAAYADLVVVNGALVKVEGAKDTVASSATELDEAVQNGAKNVYLENGTYTLASYPAGLKLVGCGDNVVFDATGKKYGVHGDVTIENVEVRFANANYTGFQHTNVETYKNCTIVGQPFLYGADVTFEGCTFEQTSADAYNVWTYGAKAVKFVDCVFNCAGKSVLIYTESGAGQTVLFEGCTLNASAPVAGKAAIEIDSSLIAGSFEVVINNTTANGFANGSVSGNSLWNNKKGNKTTITVDGVKVL